MRLMQHSTWLLAVLLLHCRSECEAFAPLTTQPHPRASTRSDSYTPRPYPHHRPASRRLDASTTTVLNVVPVDPYSLVVAASAISGGLFSGGLHAIAGPDHLAALLPRCCGQRWYRAGRVGALWGMGHGVSATLLGVVAFAVKKTVVSGGSVLFGGALGGVRLQRLLSSASSLMEVAVGLSLVLIGVMGIREAREWKDEPDAPAARSLSSAAVQTDTWKPAESRAVVLNGLLHGFSWDGAPSLAPALALATWSGNLAFLLSYAIGTMTAMAIVTTLVGEGTRRAGQVFQRPDIPQKLSLASSAVAICIGVVWCGLGLR